jgi:hypothetical protein
MLEPDLMAKAKELRQVTFAVSALNGHIRLACNG